MEYVTEIPAIKWKDGEYQEIMEKTVNDKSCYLFIDDMDYRKFSVYPKDLDDFAVGYLLGEGLIKKVDDIEKIDIIETNITIATKYDYKNKNEKDAGVMSDSAGGTRSEIDKIEPIKSTLTINATQLIKDMETLKENAKVWGKTGSVHVAQLVYKDKRIIREDVSRHVAVDKVIGAAATLGYDLTQCYITYSGRMPADMLRKFIRNQIPFIISNAAPSGSGYKLAKKANITMIGFVRGDRFNIYSGKERVNLDK